MPSVREVTHRQMSPHRPPPARPIVHFISAGRSPREDIVPDLTAFLDQPVDAREIGALDGMTGAAIAAMAPEPGEQVIHTRTGPGDWIVVSKARLTRRMQDIVSALPVEGRPLVVILSTGLLGDFPTPFPTVNAQRALETAIRSLIAEGERLGIVLPLERQARADMLPELSRFDTLTAAVETGDRIGMMEAMARLSPCDIVVLNSVSYTEADARLIRQVSGKRVILARRIIASAINLLLSTRDFTPREAPEAAMGSPADPPLSLDGLTPRERQILPLVAEGLSSKEIARQLGISPKTVEIHRTNIIRKLDVKSSRELIYQFVSRGWQ